MNTCLRSSFLYFAVACGIFSVPALADPCPEGVRKSDLHDPSWGELKEFLKTDTTDQSVYSLDSFDCNGFTLALRDNARDQGLRAAFVTIEWNEGGGHAVNAFETTDQGLVYIEPQADAVAYFKQGKVFGTIAFDKVLETIVDTSGKPEDFWKELQNVEYSGALFEYAYYENYLQRKRFLLKSVDLLGKATKKSNTEVANYNNVVNKEYSDKVDNLNAKIRIYNARSDARVTEQAIAKLQAELDALAARNRVKMEKINAEQKRIETWTQNINHLQESLGPLPGSDVKTVKKFQAYW